MRRSRVRSPSSPPELRNPAASRGVFCSPERMNHETNAVTRGLQEAEALLARGDVAQARQRCEAIVRAHPFHGGAHNFFAIVEYQRGDFRRALAMVERAVSIEPSNPDFLNSRGIILQT